MTKEVMTDKEIREECARLGLRLDEGDLIGGPFIPDGHYRIHPINDPYTVLGHGYSPQEAWDDLPFRIQRGY
jgi:hypothetical protein